MVTYERLQTDRRQFLALTGLTLPEFQLLLSSFPRAYQRLYPASRTTEGHDVEWHRDLRAATTKAQRATRA